MQLRLKGKDLRLAWLSLDPQSAISLGVVTREILKRLDPLKYDKMTFSTQSPALTPRNLGYAKAYTFQNWKDALSFYIIKLKPDVLVMYGPIELINLFAQNVPKPIQQTMKLIYYFTFELAPLPPEILEPFEILDEVWVPSLWCEEKLKEAGVKKPIYVIPHGVDSELFRFLPRKQRTDFFDYGFLGRLYGRKQANRFMTSLSILKKKVPWKFSATFHTAAEAEDIAVLRGMARRYGFEEDKDFFFNKAMLYLIALPIESLPEVYYSMNVLVHPTGGEAFGLPYLEAMATGTPIITTDMPVAREVCGDAALFCKVAEVHPSYNGDLYLVDTEDLAEKMRILHDERDRYVDLLRRGRERVKELTWEKVIEMVEERLDTYSGEAK